MALQLMSETESLTLDDGQESLLFALRAQACRPVPRLAELIDGWYKSPTFGPEATAQLAWEVRELEADFLRSLTETLIRSRGIRARDPEVLAAIVGPLLNADSGAQFLAALRQFLEASPSGVCAISD